MPLASRSCIPCFSIVAIVTLSVLLVASSQPSRAQSAYVRVSQVGYEAGKAPFRAYLMSMVAETGATFTIKNENDRRADSGSVGALLGTWSHSKTLAYYVYAIDFNVPRGDLYIISVTGPVSAASPIFAVGRPDILYSGLLLNTLFFYQTERDGDDFIRNALRTAPGHIKDEHAHVYETPFLDSNDFNDNAPPKPPLVSAKLLQIDAAGGWWDAGDYLKYVETASYTAALMQIGVRDFPIRWAPTPG